MLGCDFPLSIKNNLDQLSLRWKLLKKVKKSNKHVFYILHSCIRPPLNLDTLHYNSHLFHHILASLWSRIITFTIWLLLLARIIIMLDMSRCYLVSPVSRMSTSRSDIFRALYREKEFIVFLCSPQDYWKSNGTVFIVYLL